MCKKVILYDIAEIGEKPQFMHCHKVGAKRDHAIGLVIVKITQNRSNDVHQIH